MNLLQGRNEFIGRQGLGRTGQGLGKHKEEKTITVICHHAYRQWHTTHELASRHHARRR